MARGRKATELAAAEAAGPLLAGRYAFVRELGRGASGRVLCARDEAEGGAPRALKVVAPPDAARLRWEFGLLRAVTHPALAAVHELLVLEAAAPEPFRLAPGTTVLVEELADGERSADAAARVRGGAAERARWAVQVGRAVAGGLSAIHAAGLVHGDVKPANVVVGEDPSAARLIDLGLARPPGSDGRVSGTPGYLAPEALRGERSVATDLYGLGATLHHLLGGRGPDAESASGSVASLLARALVSPRRPESLPAQVPAPLRRLVGALLDADASRRPASAREVVARLAALSADLGAPAAAAVVGGGADAAPSAAERALAVSSLGLVGRDAPLAALRAALEAGGAVVVRGGPGAGRSRLTRDAVLGHQLACAERRAPVPTWLLARGAIPDALPEVDAIVFVEEADGVRAEDVSAALRQAALGPAALAIVLERREALSGVDRVVDLVPLGRAELTQLLHAAFGVPPQEALVEAALEASAGLPGRLCRLLAAGLRAGVPPERPEALRELAATNPEGIADLPAHGAPLARLLAVAGGALEVRHAEAVLGASVPAAAAGLVGAGLSSIGTDGRLALRPDVARALAGALAPAERRALAKALEPLPLPAAARAFVALALGRTAQAEPAMIEAIERLRRDGDPEGVAELARRLEPLVAPRAALRSRLALAAADALRARGRYAEALAALHAEEAFDATLLRAELLRLSGRAAEAAGGAAKALARATDERERVLAGALDARTLLDRGRAAECLAAAAAVLERARTVGDPATLARAAEVAALGALYAGQSELAHAHATSLSDAARQAGDASLSGRARTVEALLRAERGEVKEAAQRHALAFEAAEAAGELHAAASSLVNVGLARLDLGEPGPAIVALAEGARRLARLGRDRDLARVLYNLGLAGVLVGDDDLAQSAVRRAREAAERCGDVSVEGYARTLEAEMALRRGALLAARRTSEAAVAAVEGSGPREQAVVLSRRALILSALGEDDEARACGARAATQARGDGSDVALAEARLAAARLRHREGALEEARDAAIEGRAAAERAGTYEIRLRAALACADVLEASGARAEGIAALADARRLLDTAASTLDPPGRARMRAVAAYQRALASLPAEGPRAETHDAARWRALAHVARRLTAERRIGRLYEEILDAAIDLSGAERGFLVLRERDGALHARVARGLERKDLSSDELRYSRSIAARAVDAGAPVSSIDALADERLDGAASVHALALRSVLAVPLKRRGEVMGAIYLDDRVRPGAFGPEDEALVRELSHLASIALDGAELLRTERRTARRLSALRRELARTVETQALEIRSLRRVALEPVPGFPGIVAVSEAMRRVLDLAERVAGSDVSVLVTGESGTGKELVARAIHARSARHEGPFVGENCGAIPEPLLESALFGHVRGAFTGADRARPGLFEAADGGTLFLDEIGEMSPAMQTKLLRAVQDGEIRAVGSELTRKVDVRIVAATHRDLDALVREGRFREDLFWRLAVVRLPIPPLRDRPDDIAPLIALFVHKHAPGHEVRVDRAALARMTCHPWPGNVRQLENEVQRALVMTSEVIREEHLSPALRGEGGVAPDALDLKAQVQLLEERLIRRALEDAGGNQTKAAKRLGLSRYGLQKMMKRLGVGV